MATTNENYLLYPDCSSSSAPSHPYISPTLDDEELPPGWMKAFDFRYNQFFYVDSLAETPVSIWVHPFRHPQFLRLVGIEPNELPDDSEMEADLEGPSQSASYVSGNSSEEHLSFLKRIKEKMKADREARAAEHARFIWRRFRTKQFIYIEARRAIITLKRSCGELDEGQVKLIPPHECDYGGPWYEGDDDKSFSSKFVGALIRACGLLFSAPSTSTFLT